jgi:pseudouridine-5'-phosphate glycosidase
LEEADKIGIKGKDVTPFILSAVAKITAGKSLETSEC